jgi:hypothetical protein
MVNVPGVREVIEKFPEPSAVTFPLDVPVQLTNAPATPALPLIENSVTVKIAKFEVIEDFVAVIFVVPTPTPVARPVEALIVALLVSDDAHTDDAVMSSVEESEYVPMAVNCCVSPSAIDGLVGVTAIDTSVGAVTNVVCDADHAA